MQRIKKEEKASEQKEERKSNVGEEAYMRM
jgi:hypothetical protein